MKREAVCIWAWRRSPSRRSWSARRRSSVAQQSAPVSIGDTDLGGVVTGPNGPEAGVWVIAETTDLPTKMVKIVVTDDQGRYVMPDLPKANYDVWVRGYGLVDSPKVTTAPGKIVNLTAVPAPNEAAAAEYYPPIYWLSMLKIPDKSEFPGTGHDGNGINANIKTQTQFLREFKTDGCFHCHAVGTKATRTHPGSVRQLRQSSYEAWMRRIQSGQASKDMVETIERFGTERGAEDARRLDRPDRRRRTAGVASRRARRASSATSSSRCGTGRTRRPICTTRSPPTSAIRPSTPTARSMARPRTAPTSCRSSIRSRAPRRR